MRYYFRSSPPGDGVKLRIPGADGAGPLLAATFSGRHRPLSAIELSRSFFALPVVTFKVIAAIHWEALRLRLKGIRPVPRRESRLASGKTSDYT